MGGDGLERAMQLPPPMNTERLGWLVLATGVALVPVGLGAPYVAHDPSDFDDGYDEDPEDDWLYDYYERVRGEQYANYDGRSDPYEWEYDGLFA